MKLEVDVPRLPRPRGSGRFFSNIADQGVRSLRRLGEVPEQFTGSPFGATWVTCAASFRQEDL